MTYAYYHNIIKGKSPKNAPTYQPEDLDTVDSASSDSRHRGLHRRDYRGGGEGTFRRQRKRDKSNLEYPREESV